VELTPRLAAVISNERLTSARARGAPLRPPHTPLAARALRARQIAFLRCTSAGRTQEVRMRLLDHIAQSTEPLIVRQDSGEQWRLTGASDFARRLTQCPLR
jgi:hypothetical protein